MVAASVPEINVDIVYDLENIKENPYYNPNKDSFSFDESDLPDSLRFKYKNSNEKN